MMRVFCRRNVSMSRAFAPLLALCLASATVYADDLSRGLQAYDAGDYAAAIAAWQKAAAAGNTDAMNALANAYQRGEGVRANLEEAVHWYRLAAERGNVVAQLNLGDLASRGEGMKRNPVEAYFWLGLAAAKGNRWAQQGQKQVATELTHDEITAGNARIDGWKPAGP